MMTIDQLQVTIKRRRYQAAWSQSAFVGYVDEFICAPMRCNCTSIIVFQPKSCESKSCEPNSYEPKPCEPKPCEPKSCELNRLRVEKE